MSLLIAVGALALLMFVAYRGYSVILFAPVCALLAVLLTDPSAVAPMFTGLFMDKMVGFLKLVLPGLPARRGVRQGDRAVGLLEVDRRRGHQADRARARDAVDRAGVRAADLRRRVAVRRGVRGVSVRRRDVPPGRHPEAADPRHHRARRVHLHDGLAAGQPQIQNIIPTTFFRTNTWAAPWLGVDRRRVHPRRRPDATSSGAAAQRPRPAKATAKGTTNEPEPVAGRAAAQRVRRAAAAARRRRDEQGASRD